MSSAFTIEEVILGIGVLLLASIAASKASNRVGIPSLVVFLLLGMVLGPNGLFKFKLEDPVIAQAVSIVALVFILFDGGLDTDWRAMRQVLWKGLSLSTLGIVFTTLLVAWFSQSVLGLTWNEGLLLGAIIAPTDAAAIFALLKARNMTLSTHLRELAELESGSNDAMAVFLTLGFIHLIQTPGADITSLIPHFVLEMTLGAAIGYVMGKVIPHLINRLELEIEGLYPVLTVALALLTFGFTSELGGSGFLAVYVAGVVTGNSRFYFKRRLRQFHDGVTWIMQIVMFLTLGLLVVPHDLPPIMPMAMVLALFLMLIARPVAVIFALVGSTFSFKAKLMISWMGLRGATPIILATFPLVAGLPRSSVLFNLVFFVVLTSILIQGSSVGVVARWLKMEVPLTARKRHMMAYGHSISDTSEMNEVLVPYSSPAVGHSVMSLNLPSDAIILLISREEGTLVPTGRTHLEGGDVMMVLGDRKALDRVYQSIMPPKKNPT